MKKKLGVSKTKKLLALLLAAVLVIACTVPLISSADENDVAVVTDESVVTEEAA